MLIQKLYIGMDIAKFMEQIYTSKRLIAVLILLLQFVMLQGQVTFQPKLDIDGSKGIVYKTDNILDLRPHTHGMSIGVQLGSIRTYYKSYFSYYSLGYVTDSREQRQTRSPSRLLGLSSKSFCFGKRNHIINLRAGRGVRRLRSGESKRRGVSIGYAYQGGLTLAILNPVYLNLLYETDNSSVLEVKEEKYSEANAKVFTDKNRIYGGTSYFRGFRDLSIRPGLQGSAGAVFSFGNFDKYAKILEVGIMVDVFLGKLPIMVETDAISNKPYLVNFYASFQFGRRR